jgi:hypothetical protein
MMDLHARQFTSSTLVKAAGCEQVTLRAWRNRNGLFPELGSGTGWHRFSFLDICIVRAVTLLTTSGIRVPDAVWFANTHLGIWFEDVLSEREDVSSIIGFYNGPVAGSDDHVFFVFLRPSDTIAEVVAKSASIITILDLEAITRHVLSVLEELSAGGDQSDGSNAPEAA